MEEGYKGVRGVEDAEELSVEEAPFVSSLDLTYDGSGRLGERISYDVAAEMMDSVLRRSDFFIRAELHMWRSEYNYDGCTNSTATNRWRIRLHI
ncbi:hypothetical protein EVAR_96297_1 [Eumeta japonica]|uniref:Uncharacterized protein n=1 Tax=Eumeta variegata TaxID=151549 RepID=A0A4C1VXR3_EUMVA|nr:hypothetical protein EVAR_96297_1 [Eumeta japonica]